MTLKLAPLDEDAVSSVVAHTLGGSVAPELGKTVFETTWRADVFSGAPQSSSVASFGTLGVNLHARKPETDHIRLRNVLSENIF
jgi:hypothetical protein